MRTLVTLIVSGLVILGSFYSELEPFEGAVDFLEAMEVYQLDEFLLMAPLVLIGLLADIAAVRRRREERIIIQQQRLHILKATMTTVHDIVNNFLNNLQIFRLEMEEKNTVDREQIELFDSLVYDTTMKLRAISNLKDTPIKHMGGGMQGIDVDKALEAQAKDDTDTQW